MSNQQYAFDQAKTFFENRVAFTTGTHELEVLLKSTTPSTEYQIVDVRFSDDYAQAHIPGAINLPITKWGNKRYLEQHLSKDATLYLYCYTPTCHLATQAAVKLIDAGYKAVEVEGGWQTWVQSGYATEEGHPVAQLKSA